MSETAPKKKHSVLLIDDDQFLLSMYSIKFKNLGFEVETITSATSALQKLRDGLKPDMVLCDLVMPTMDGLEFIRRFKEERLSPSSLVVVLSNFGQSAEVEKAKDLGVDGFIIKASTIPSEVVAEVKALLTKKK
ncbi:MAG: response regulator [bacterium]|nr:response regulator [bacterium]